MKLSHILRSVVTLSLCSLVALFALAPQAHAQWRDASFGAEYDDADTRGAVNSGAYVDRVQKGAMASIACQILPIGPSSEGAQDGLCTNDTTRLGAMYQKSVIGSLNGYIAMLYDRRNSPATTYAFIQDMGQTLGFIPKSAYAQGVGFSGLAALLPIWKAFRNIAYLLLAIVMIVIGFMVMLRKKIDPKTVVTVQNALPRIVITLLLITFSYAIVGLMIDLMYLTYAVVVGIIVNSSNGIFGPDTTQKMLTGGWGEAVGLVGRGWGAVDDIFNFFTSGGSQGLTETTIGTGWLMALSQAASGYTLGALMVLIVTLILLFGAIRLFVMLLSAYIQIILSLLTAPLQILAEALPGTNAFASWLTNLVSNLLVFPITAALLMIGEFLARSSAGAIWAPPLIAGNTIIGRNGASAGIAGIIGLGILISIPNVVKSMKEMLKAKPAVSFGGGQGGGLMQFVSTAFYLKSLAPQQWWDRLTGQKQGSGGHG